MSTASATPPANIKFLQASNGFPAGAVVAIYRWTEAGAFFTNARGEDRYLLNDTHGTLWTWTHEPVTSPVTPPA